MVEKPVSRRRWAEIAGGTAAGIIVGGAAAYLAALGARAPAVTQTVTETVKQTTKETVTATATPAPKLFEGVTIDYITGATGCPFTAVMNKGAGDAQELLGCKVNYVFGQWDPERMVTEFRDAIGRKPDGILIMGHPGDEAYEDLIPEAFERGIKVTVGNVDLPQNREKFSGAGMGYVGSDLYEHGVSLAKLSLRRFDLKSGDRVGIISGCWEQPGRNLRPIGAEDAFKEEGLMADRIVGELAVQTDPAVALKYITGYCGAHPDVKLIAYDGGIILGGAELYMGALGKKPGDILNVGFDLMPEVIDGIEKGYVQFTMDQQPYLQGFMPTVNLCLAIEYGFQGIYMNTGAAFIDETNCELVKELVDDKIRG